MLRCMRARNRPQIKQLDLEEVVGRQQHSAKKDIFSQISTQCQLLQGKAAGVDTTEPTCLEEGSPFERMQHSTVTWKELKRWYLGHDELTHIKDMVKRVSSTHTFLFARLVCFMAEYRPRDAIEVLSTAHDGIQKRLMEAVPRADARKLIGLVAYHQLPSHVAQWLFEHTQHFATQWRCPHCRGFVAGGRDRCPTCAAASRARQCAGCRLWVPLGRPQCPHCSAFIPQDGASAAFSSWKCGCGTSNASLDPLCRGCRSAPPQKGAARTQCASCQTFLHDGLEWCVVCGAARGAHEVWDCSWCRTQNPLRAGHCTQCGEERLLVNDNRPAEHWECSLCFTTNAPWMPSCSRCTTTRLTAGHAARCPMCHGPTYEGSCVLCTRGGWLCCHHGCMTACLSSQLSCPVCDTSRGILHMDEDALLGWGSDAPPLSAALLPVPPDACSVCGASGAPTFSGCCADCTAPSSPRLAELWVALRQLQLITDTPLLSPQTMTAIECAMKVLTSPSTMYPWNGSDPLRSQSCTSPTAPVFADGTVHSAYIHIRGTLNNIISLSSEFPVFRKRLLDCAVTLVDKVNNTTEFDEIGFTTLAALCYAIHPNRPGVETELRLQYLTHMQLSCDIIRLQDEKPV